MKQIIMIILCILAMYSCKKQEPIQGHGCSDVVASGSTEATGIDGSEKDGDGLQTPSSAYACDPTPIPGTWYIKQSYLNTYQHFYQMDAKPEYPGNVLCGPTSYMLAGHMIVTAKGGSYPSSKTKVGAIYAKLKVAGKFDDALGMYIGDVGWFCQQYDNPVIKTSYKRTSERALMKEFIEYNIKAGYPVIATVQIYGANNSIWDLHDADMYDQANTSYYVSKNGPIGHFILLIGIKINADGSGTVWYKDPLSKTGSTQSASYTRILDAMKYNGNNDYYDAVAVFDGVFVSNEKRFTTFFPLLESRGDFA